jgi:hypothetical protein
LIKRTIDANAHAHTPTRGKAQAPEMKANTAAVVVVALYEFPGALSLNQQAVPTQRSVYCLAKQSYASSARLIR